MDLYQDTYTKKNPRQFVGKVNKVMNYLQYHRRFFFLKKLETSKTNAVTVNLEKMSRRHMRHL